MSVERFDAIRHYRMVDPIPFGVQCHQGIDPWRLNAAPSSVRVLVLDDPIETKTNRQSPARLNRKFDVPTQEPIRHEKETFPGKEPLFGSKPVIKIISSLRVQFVE